MCARSSVSKLASTCRSQVQNKTPSCITVVKKSNFKGPLVHHMVCIHLICASFFNLIVFWGSLLKQQQQQQQERFRKQEDKKVILPSVYSLLLNWCSVRPFTRSHLKTRQREARAHTHTPPTLCVVINLTRGQRPVWHHNRTRWSSSHATNLNASFREQQPKWGAIQAPVMSEITS